MDAELAIRFDSQSGVAATPGIGLAPRCRRLWREVADSGRAKQQRLKKGSASSRRDFRSTMQEDIK